MSEMALDGIEFAENPEPRCPCVLLLDTSGSMSGNPIAALNEGLRAFKEELLSDSVAARRVEVAVVTFDSETEVAHPFATPDAFHPPVLEAQGLTHMASGIQTALDMVDARKAEYRANDVAYYRPWVFMITDGEPQGELDHVVEDAVRKLQKAESDKRVAFFAVGVEGANFERLAEISIRTPLKLKGLQFKELFVWLSRSMQAVSQSKPEEQVALPPAGWAVV